MADEANTRFDNLGLAELRQQITDVQQSLQTLRWDIQRCQERQTSMEEQLRQIRTECQDTDQACAKIAKLMHDEAPVIAKLVADLANLRARLGIGKNDAD